VSKGRKVSAKHDLVAMEVDAVKEMPLKEVLQAAFCSLRLSKQVDENVIMNITKRIKGFNNRMIAWSFLKMYLENQKILSDA
jgi:hypothetical protein